MWHIVIENVRMALTRLGVLTANPWAFAIVLAYGGVWWMFDSPAFDFHAVATLSTWLMTLLIQRAEHRDAQAMHAKLDELLRAHRHATTEMAQIDKQEPEDIERHRAQAQANDVHT